MSLPMYISENGGYISHDEHYNYKKIFIYNYTKYGIILFIIAIFIIYCLSFEQFANNNNVKVDTIKLLRNNVEQQINYQCENNSNYNSAIMITHVNISNNTILIYIQLNNSK